MPSSARDLARLAARYHDKIHIINKLPANDLIAVMDGLDSWRKPERITQLSLISEADARGRLYLSNKPIHKGNFLDKHLPLRVLLRSNRLLNKGLQVRKFAKN